jgi:hypothetical protein
MQRLLAYPDLLPDAQCPLPVPPDECARLRRQLFRVFQNGLHSPSFPNTDLYGQPGLWPLLGKSSPRTILKIAFESLLPHSTTE